MRHSIDESMVADFEAISCVYRLLSRLLIAEVDIDFLGSHPSSLRESFAQIGGWLPTSVDAQTIEELSGDYCQLFVGPSGHFPPYQSVWQDGQFQGDSTVSMEKYCKIARFTPSGIAERLMLDHLGIQMKLMGHILEQISTVGSPTDRESIVEFAGCFSNAHLQWPEPMLRSAEEASQTLFYQSNLKLIRRFLGSEAEFWKN